MHPLVRLAKQTIEGYVKTGKVPAPDVRPEGLEEFASLEAGVFVSLKKLGQLRGCIGTFAPTKPSVVEETVANAVSAATRDPRFEPVEAEELVELDISVDVLSAPEAVTDRARLDPKRYGVIVTSGVRRGLLLPDLEGVDTVEGQLNIACMKAGISPDDEGLKIQRFEVKRYR